MQAISRGRRFTRAGTAAARAEAVEGGGAAAFRRGILDRWHLARREDLTAGKAKIAVAVHRKGQSAIGRVLAHLVRQGSVEPVPTLRKKAPRAARSRRAWARRRFPEGGIA